MRWSGLGMIAALGAAAVAPPHAGRGLAADPAAARVQVEFVRPERFADVRDSAMRSEKGTAAILDELARFLREAGGRRLGEGQSLAIRVTDIDLAGEFEPTRGPQRERTRIMREAYPPRIELQFRLEDAEGRTLAAGQRTLRDPMYLTRSVPVWGAAFGERLRYEERMLDDWLREELGR